MQNEAEYIKIKSYIDAIFCGDIIKRNAILSDIKSMFNDGYYLRFTSMSTVAIFIKLHHMFNGNVVFIKIFDGKVEIYKNRNLIKSIV